MVSGIRDSSEILKSLPPFGVQEVASSNLAGPTISLETKGLEATASEPLFIFTR